MTVAIARVTLFLGESHSLKEKRMVLRRIKDLVRNKFNVSIAEVSENDRWQRAVLGLTLVGSDRRFAESALDEVLRFIRGHVQVSNEEKELQIVRRRAGRPRLQALGGVRDVAADGAGRRRGAGGRWARCWRATRSRIRACAAPA